jgi:predicted phosphodiesterase
MRIAFIADVHANLPALEAVIADAREHGATHLLCLGDIVGYGPQPLKTLARIREVASGVLLGNHDAAAAELLDLNCFNPFAKETAARAILALDDDAKAYLRGLPYLLEVKNIACAHGCFDAPETYRYLETEEDAARSLAAMPGFTLLVVGHTHVPRVFEEENGTLRTLPPNDFQLRPGCRYVVNPGSVGFPRTDTLTADYLIYDTLLRRLTFRAVVYDLAPYRLALVRNGYNPLNYWFLSPSARKRRNELALCNPPKPATDALSEPVGFRPLPKKRPLRHWFFGLCAAALVVMTILALTLTTRPTTPTADPATKVYYNPSNLLAPLQHWAAPQELTAIMNLDLNQLELRPTGSLPQYATLLSPWVDLPADCDRLRFSFKTQSIGRRKEKYSVRAMFIDENGNSLKGALHSYKSAKAQAFTIEVPPRAKTLQIQFNFELQRPLKLQKPELEALDK